MAPDASSAEMERLFMWPAPGISWSRPRPMLAECVAVQSLITLYACVRVATSVSCHEYHDFHSNLYKYREYRI